MTSPAILNAQRQLAAYRQRDRVAHQLPIQAGDTTWIANLQPPVPKPQPKPAPRPSVMRDEIDHHGDIAIAAMRAGQSVHYQLWLLMRLLDKEGSGRVNSDKLRLHLTNGFSKHRLYNYARLRQILVEGNGRYWTLPKRSRANNYIYYAATHTLAHNLNLTRLIGRFVTITADQAKAPAAHFRAWSFAAWLANRRNPITQQTIQRLTGITPRSQRRYADLIGITRHRNIAIGPRHTATNAQEQAWQRGTSLFDFTDYNGRHGPAGRKYCAWHLPNAYVCLETGTRSKQRSTNKRLSVLVKNGAQGNRQAFNGQHTRLFFENGAHIAKQARQTVDQDTYWRGPQARTGTALWYVRGNQP